MYIILFNILGLILIFCGVITLIDVCIDIDRKERVKKFMEVKKEVTERNVIGKYDIEYLEFVYNKLDEYNKFKYRSEFKEIECVSYD